MIMKGCMQWNPVYDWKDPHLELMTARSVGQRLTHWATGAPMKVGIPEIITPIVL